MKKYWIGIICLLATINLNAQLHSTIDELIKHVQDVITYDSTVISRLLRAEATSTKLSSKEHLLIKSTLAEALLLRDDRQALKKSKDAFLYAQENGLSMHPDLGRAYITQSIYHYRRYNFFKAIEIGEVGLSCLSIDSPAFDKLSYIVGSSYCKESIKNDRVLDLMKLLDKKQKKTAQTSTLFYERALKGMYHLAFSSVSEKLVCTAMSLKGIKHNDPRVELEGEINNIKGLVNLGQYDEVKQYLLELDSNFQSIPLDALSEISYNITLAEIYSGIPLKSKRDFKKAVDKAKKIRPLIQEEAPNLAGLSAFWEIYYVYKEEGKAKARPMFLEAQNTYGDVSNLIHDWVYFSSHHSKDFDFALEGYQKMLERSYPLFNGKNIYDNPDISKINPDIYQPANYILRWKCRTLYKQALTLKDEEKAIFLFKESIKAGELSARLLFDYLENYYPYKFSWYVHQPWQHMTFRFMLSASYEIYKRNGDLSYLYKMFDLIEKSKGISSNSILSKMKLPKEIERTIHLKMHELQEIEKDWQLSYKDKKVTITKQFYEKIEEIDAYMSETRAKYPDIQFEYEATESTGVKDVQAKLADDEAFIQYKEAGGTRGFAYLITKDTQRIVEYPVNGSFWNRETQKFARLLQNPMQLQVAKRQRIIQNGHKIYKYLIGPFEQELANKKKLIIAGDKDIYYMPFEALLPSDEIKPFHELDFLIKRFSISYFSSAAMYLKHDRKMGIKDKSMLAFAPVFEDKHLLAADDRSISAFSIQKKLLDGIKNDAFSPLPNTEEEVETISSLLSANANVILKKDAKKHTLQKALQEKSYQFIHIATHGFVNYFNPTLSALACYNKANIRGQNFLYSSEIENMKIDADLVILSSCESGIGRILEGESLMALNRSFLIAGAKNVIYSLWKVNDTYTKDLMIDFYKNTNQENTSYTTALRNAKLTMLKNPETASPRYWAPFILMGE